jgi:5-methylcytosine-specific restriction endonuclease McrA
MMDYKNINRYSKPILQNGIFIPMEAVRDRRLTVSEKNLAGIILTISECCEEEKLDVSNAFLSIFINRNPSTTSAAISKLAELRYIIVHNDINEKRTIQFNSNFQKEVGVKNTIPVLDKSKNDKASRKKIFSKTNGCCTYCGKLLEFSKQWHIDHIQPRAKKGNNKQQNLVPSCKDCNLLKTDRTLDEFKEAIKKKTIKHLNQANHEIFKNGLVNKQIKQLIQQVKNCTITFNVEDILKRENSIRKSMEDQNESE